MSAFSPVLLERLERTQVVAGFSVDRADEAVPIVKALLAGGVDAIELTLRTPAAMEAIRQVCAEVPDMLVGVGIFLTPAQIREVKTIGVDFGVSPGMNPRIIRAAQDAGLPFAPGICTPSDLEAAIELDCRFVKFFPAEASGGVPYLRSMAAPYQHLGIRFFPLGGLNARNMMDYLQEEIVAAIGGSWIVQRDLVEQHDWAALTERAAAVRHALQASTNPTQPDFNTDPTHV